MPQLKVSFIVPVYKTQQFLPKCLDSLLAQTYRNIEIVVVNDGSPDDSQSIIDDYRSRDHRVVSVVKPNGGLSSARNAGMRQATGDIIDFVDSDDYVDDDLSQVLVDTFSKSHPDILVFGAVCEPEGAASKRILRLLSPQSATFDAFSPDLLFCSNAQPYVWRSAYSRSFIEKNRLSFAENVRFAEDVVFQFESYPLAQKVDVVPDKLYHYVMQEESLTHTFNVGSKRSDKVAAHLLMLHEVLERWRNHGLLDCCSGETVSWILDLLGFDLLRMDESERSTTSKSLTAELSAAFGTKWPALPAKSGTRHFAKKVAECRPLNFTDATGLYLSTRGIKGCLERFF